MNVLLILFTDYLLVSNFGWYSLFYLLLSSFFAGSLHPCAAHFIAEHYLLKDLTENTPDGQEADEKIVGVRELAQETTSYYGWLNVLCYNVSTCVLLCDRWTLAVDASHFPQVGYHNEHHDFPSVPWTRLPELHRIAREFYDPLPSHPSWPAVTWQFITDSRVGMFSRAKREMGAKGERIEEHTWTVSKPAACNDLNAVGAKTKVVYVSKPDLKVVDGGEGDKLLEQLMEEAVERGYE
jgi:sphingolipid delta-4 desaturase